MMKVVMSLLLALSLGSAAPTVVAQESREGLAQRLRALYGPPIAETFVVQRGVLMRARYSDGGLACSLRIEPESPIEERTLPVELAEALLKQFVPKEERRHPTQAVGLTSGPCGGIESEVYPLVGVSRTSRCDDAGVAWLQGLSIQYKTDPCKAFLKAKAEKGAYRGEERAHPEEVTPEWARWATEDLRALYGPPLEQSFAVGEDAVLKARLGSDGQPCRMVIERQAFSRSALAPQAAEKILAGLPPLADAGAPLEESSVDVWECVRREQADYTDFSVEVQHSSCTSSGGLGMTRIVVDFMSDQCPRESDHPGTR